MKIRIQSLVAVIALGIMASGQNNAGEPKWVEFQGKYTNALFAYHVVVPPGLKGRVAAPPAPDHGFGVDLELAANAYIWVDGSYNALDYPSALSAIQESVKWLEKEHTLVGKPVFRHSKMASLPAQQLLVRYRKGKNGEERAREEIVAIRKTEGIIYTIGLDTTAARFTKDRQILLALLSTIGFDRHLERMGFVPRALAFPIDSEIRSGVPRQPF